MTTVNKKRPPTTLLEAATQVDCMLHADVSQLETLTAMNCHNDHVSVPSSKQGNCNDFENRSSSMEVGCKH